MHPEHSQFILEFELFCYLLWALSFFLERVHDLYSPTWHFPALSFILSTSFCHSQPWFQSDLLVFGFLFLHTLQWHLLFWYTESPIFKEYLSCFCLLCGIKVSSPPPSLSPLSLLIKPLSLLTLPGRNICIFLLLNVFPPYYLASCYCLPFWIIWDFLDSEQVICLPGITFKSSFFCRNNFPSHLIPLGLAHMCEFLCDLQVLDGCLLWPIFWLSLYVILLPLPLDSGIIYLS